MPAELKKSPRTCPKCGAVVSAAAQVCRCGQVLTPIGTVPVEPTQPEGPPPADADDAADRVRHQDDSGEFRPPPPKDPAPAGDAKPTKTRPPDPVVIKASDAADQASDSSEPPAPPSRAQPMPPPPPPPEPEPEGGPAPIPAKVDPAPRTRTAPLPAPEPAPRFPPIETLPVPQPLPPPAPQTTPDSSADSSTTTTPTAEAGASTVGAVLAAFGIHAERGLLAAGAAVAGAILGALVAPAGTAWAWAFLIGVFAVAAVLWAPGILWLWRALALVVFAAVVQRMHTEWGLLALPAALAFTTAPENGTVRWFVHGLVVAGAIALPLEFYARRGSGIPAVVATCVVAVVALAASHRIAKAIATLR